MVLLVASVVALLVGPALARVAGDRRGPLAALDGFIVAALLGLVLVDVLPDAFEHAGSAAVVAAVVGVALPRLLEGKLRVAEGQLHGAVTWGAVLGYAIHATLDGAALVGSNGGGALGLGVVLHRVPVGVTMWWLVRPRHGARGVVLAMALIGVATAVGFVGATRVVDALPLGSLGVFQALVGGSLLHVVAGHEHGDDAVTAEPAWATAGAMVGVLTLVGVVHASGAEAAHGAPAFAHVARTVAPWVLLGGGASIVLARVVGDRLSAWGARIGGARGLGDLAALAVSFGVLGLRWSIVRLAVAAPLMLLVRGAEPTAETGAAGRLPVRAKVERLATRLLLGVALAALAREGFEGLRLEHPAWVLAAAAAGAVVPMTALSAVVAATAVHAVSPAAALTLSVVAPLAAVRGGRGSASSANGSMRALVIAAVLVSMGVGAVGAFTPQWLGADQAGASAIVVDGVVANASVLVFLLVLASLLLRSGPRGLVAAVVASTSGVDHAVHPDASARPHAHHHGHAHHH